jgi:hypothetical protein
LYAAKTFRKPGNPSSGTKAFDRKVK